VDIISIGIVFQVPDEQRLEWLTHENGPFS